MNKIEVARLTSHEHTRTHNIALSSPTQDWLTTCSCHLRSHSRSSIKMMALPWLLTEEKLSLVSHKITALGLTRAFLAAKMPSSTDKSV